MDRQSIVGMRFPAHSHTISKAEADAYAAATNAQATEAAVPMFAVFLEMPPLMEAIKTPEVIGDPKRFLRLLHGEHDMRWHGVLHPGHTYSTEASIARVAGKASGEIIDLKLETKDDRGALMVETVASMFIRAEQKESAAGAGPAPEPRPEPKRDYAFTADEQVAPDQSLRYAAASGDHNPIHTDPAVAQKAGLPGIILHGLCTMAFCQNAVVRTLCKGDASKLKRLKVRFAKPVLMGQTLSIHGWHVEPQVFAFEARAAGAQVLKDGIAELHQ